MKRTIHAVVLTVCLTALAWAAPQPTKKTTAYPPIQEGTRTR